MAKLKIKILKVYEQGNTLRVETETDYGLDNLGLSLEAKYLNPETNKPKWQKEVRELLEKKYNAKNAKKVNVDKDTWDMEI